MTVYRRLYVPGGTYFFSAHLQDRRSDALVTNVDVLRNAVRLTRKRWPFVIEAAVILPNQMHMIWTMPTNDTNFSKRWRMLKSTFSHHVPAPPYRSPSQIKRGDKGIWQRRFLEHMIQDGQDFDLHYAKIKDAPVAMGLVEDAAAWPYSSFNKSRRKLRQDA